MLSALNLITPEQQSRPYNFAPGPATLPFPVLSQIAADLYNWQGSGVSVMEMSHRSPEFERIYHHAVTDLRELLQVPQNFKILFMQGGGLAQNAIVPMNIVQGKPTDFIVTGSWSERSAKEAMRYGNAQVVAHAKDSFSGFYGIPGEQGWEIRSDAAYVHICSNETIHGVEFYELPDLKALTGRDLPLVVDASSHILSRFIDWSRVGLLFAGAQKNIGIAGVTLVFVREDLIGKSIYTCPSVFDYETLAKTNSMYNTPPTFAIYVAGLVFQWIKEQGGVKRMQELANERSNMIYACIDESNGFYKNQVAPSARSKMNIPFVLQNDELSQIFVEQAAKHKILHIKGHKSVGGMRASVYNAMPVQGAVALVDFMKAFAKQYG